MLLLFLVKTKINSGVINVTVKAPFSNKPRQIIDKLSDIRCHWRTVDYLFDIVNCLNKCLTQVFNTSQFYFAVKSESSRLLLVINFPASTVSFVLFCL